MPLTQAILNTASFKKVGMLAVGSQHFNSWTFHSPFSVVPHEHARW